MFTFIDHQFMLAVAGLAFVSGMIFAMLLYRQMRSELVQRQPDSLPEVAVLIPCKYDSDSLVANIESILDQQYPGRLSFIFVVASEAVPAYARLREICERRSDKDVQVLVSHARPTRSCEKILNLVHGLAHIRRGCEILLFADSDICVRSDWAWRLVAALRDPSAGVATGLTLFIPTTRNLWTMLQLVWIVAALPYLRLLPKAMGWSMAVRRADFERFNVSDSWLNSISEDNVLDFMLKRHKFKTRLVLRALSANFEESDRRQFFRVFNNWTVYSRVYVPVQWLFAALALLAKVWILVWAIRSSCWDLLAIALGGDMTLTGVSLIIVGRAHAAQFSKIPSLFRPYALWGALASPLILVVYLVNFAYSMIVRRVWWGGYTYHLKGPFKIEVLADPS